MRHLGAPYEREIAWYLLCNHKPPVYKLVDLISHHLLMYPLNRPVNQLRDRCCYNRQCYTYGSLENWISLPLREWEYPLAE